MPLGTNIFIAVLGVLFLVTGSPKVVGVKYFARAFEKFGYPQWLRVVAGVIEVIGGAGLLAGIWFPPTATLGALLIFPVMCGATYTNYVKVNSTNGTGTLVIVGLVLLSAWLTLPQAMNTLGMSSPW